MKKFKLVFSSKELAIVIDALLMYMTYNPPKRFKWHTVTDIGALKDRLLDIRVKEDSKI